MVEAVCHIWVCAQGETSWKVPRNETAVVHFRTQRTHFEKKKNEFFKLVVRNLLSRVTQLIMSPSVTFSPNYFSTFYLLFKSSSVLGEDTSWLISDPVAEVFVAYEPSFPKNNRWTSPLLYHAFGKSKISFRRRMS